MRRATVWPFPRVDALTGFAGAEAPVRAAAGARNWPITVLCAGFVLSLVLKIVNVAIGGPQYMIDDFTLYEGGFLVWFGQAPPQHAYLESWISGLCSLVVFTVKTAASGGGTGPLDGDIVSAALRSFYNAPDIYYVAYRSVLVAVDMVTAVVVFTIARRVLAGSLWPPVWVTLLFLFTYNTLWSALIGRPDTLMTCAATIGMHLYLKSVTERAAAPFWWAAICFGLAAGLKMHGALFTVFAAIDVIRRNGVRAGVRPAVSFAAVAFFFFLVADGSLLSDPLMYVKARWATYHDDYSPHIQWGDQFRVILRSTGWGIVPLALAGAIGVLRDRATPRALQSVAVIALGWLLIFATTRQLRGYWMLAASPLFYLLAASALAKLRQPRIRIALMAAILAVMIGQTAALSWKTRQTDLNELRAWVTSHVQPGEQFYILGDAILRLPKDTRAMALYKTGYEREMAADRSQGMPFVERHLKNWEERAQLRLFDMMGFQNPGGYRFFGYRDFPTAKFGDLVSLETMDYLIVQEQFRLDQVAGLEALVAERFHPVAERRSEGGDGRGLRHRIYRRNAP